VRPLSWRVLLFEIFAEAERHGLGTVDVQFNAAPGRSDEAADFIGARADFLADNRLGGESE
jgi:hypothetical protein